MEAIIKTTSKTTDEAPTSTIKVVTIATKPMVVHSFEVGATYAQLKRTRASKAMHLPELVLRLARRNLGWPCSCTGHNLG